MENERDSSGAPPEGGGARGVLAAGDVYAVLVKQRDAIMAEALAAQAEAQATEAKFQERVNAIKAEAEELSRKHNAAVAALVLQEAGRKARLDQLDQVAESFGLKLPPLVPATPSFETPQ